MIQKKYPATWERREPWRFIPRRDLFPDVELSEQQKEHQNDKQRAKPGTRPMASSETEISISQPRKIPERKSPGTSVTE